MMLVLPSSFPQPSLPARENKPRFETFKRTLDQGNEHEFHEVNRLIEQSLPNVDDR